MKKIGIFAGSFDPVHLGHVAFVEQATREYGLDEGLILVEKTPRYKTCLATFEHRTKMVELAFANNSQIIVYETTIDDFPITTGLPLIRAEYPGAQLYLLIGEDVAEHIESWENAENLLEGVEQIIGKRGKQSPHGMASSFQIRTSLKQQKISDDLDPRVQEYINKQNLYQA